MSRAHINLFWLIIFSLTLPLAVLGSTQLARRSFEKVKLRGQTVSVKGYAEQPIVSDRAEWSATLTARDADRTAAYDTLAQHREVLLRYLGENSFLPDQVALGPVYIAELYVKDKDGRNTNSIEAYRVSQRFSIASGRVKDIADVARRSDTLIAQGLDLSAGSPDYLYTQLDAMKLEMLGRATQNARERAALLLDGSGTTLGGLRSASQGVFQITPAFSTEVSSSGQNDTSSLNKVIKAVVTIEYAINE